MYEIESNHDEKVRGSPDTQSQDDEAFPTLKLEPEKYKGHLEGLEITDEQVEELLKILWNIMYTMVDIGMGFDSIQTLFAALAENAGQDSGKDSTIEDRKNSFNESAKTNKKKA